MKVQDNSWCRSKGFLRVAASSNPALKRTATPPLSFALGDMGTLWRSLVEAVTKDDLFIRVTLFVFGACALALGFVTVREALHSSESWGWLLAFWIIGAMFISWGTIVVVGAFTPPLSRWSKVAEKCYPNPAALDDAVVFLIIVLIPAVMLTLLLRAFGVRGYVT